jgi:LysM repeat protein
MKHIYLTPLLLVSIAGSFALLAISGPQPAQADSPPDAAAITGVIGHPQHYVLSCEARSAVDWAAFWGTDISESEFLGNLSRTDNPETGFVGQPNDAWGNIPPGSYGVHAGPVAALLRNYGLQATAQRGLGWDDLRAEIAAGRPAIVWIIGQMWNGRPRTYTASDGQSVVVAPFEHTMILVGYTPTQVQVVDAYSGQTQNYALNAFLTSWAVLGNQAVTGQGLADPIAPSHDETTYTVQVGDYLVALAGRFHTTWQALVLRNAIPYPYTIYAGQVLHLPSGTGATVPEMPTPVTVPTSSPTPTPTSTPAPAGGIYTVQRGEYLSLIAHKLGVDWQSLATLNQLTPPYVLYTGQVLQLPAGDILPLPPAGEVEVYTVQPGDYLASIALRFGLDWRDLAALNDIAYPYVVYNGQVLRLR